MAAWLTTIGSTLEPHPPEELLLQLSPEAHRFVSGRFAGLLQTGFTTPRRLGIAALDRLLDELGVTLMTVLHPQVSHPDVSDGLSAFRRAMGATYRLRLSPRAAPVADAVRVFKALLGLVSDASPNPLRITQDTPNDPQLSAQWGLDAIACRAAWDRQSGSPAVIAGVIDTGVQSEHPDLAPALLPGRSFVDLMDTPPPEGWRWEGTLSPNLDSRDEVGHGTHVAGIIAAQTGNGIGIAGIARGCRLLPVRVLARLVRHSDGAVKGAGTAADIAKGIRWAVDQGVAVLNLSFGLSEVTFAERDAIDYAIAHHCVPVAAIGNEGQAGGTMFPAALAGVLAVGAVDRNLRKAPFSQTAAHLALAAPGVGILSTLSPSGYGLQDGTSMATAFVSGVAALLRSANPSLTAAQVGTLLRESARLVPGQAAPNDSFGAGLVDADRALRTV